MLTIGNISIHFANRYLFDNVSFSVGDSDRIGLIGRNGTGKSTLLKIIAGLEFPEEGAVIKPNDYKIGYLPQEGIINSTKSVYAETRSALNELHFIEEKINELNIEIAHRKDYESSEYLQLIQQLSEYSERARLLGLSSIDAEIEKILTGLGFNREDFSKPIPEFSGGWQMRIELAKILISRPNCVLLDEPTNHLDLESIQWLEDFLKNYQGSVIIVSHDRKFLNSVTNRTIEISLGKIYDLNLPYSKFIEVRQEQKEQQISAFKNQQRQIAQTERFIERFRYKATFATRVQSRVKQLDKLDRIEVEDEDLSSIRFNFPEAPRSGRLVVETSNLTKRYGNKLVLDKINFAIERGERVAFVGKNGEGKSTLTKIIAGTENYEGKVNMGFNVQIGYFAQHQAELLDGNSTVFDIIDTAATGEMRTRVRTLLGAFLFSGESVYKKVKVLSGGEKSRLSLARMLLQPFNLLILDEPTNHLDMVAKDVLKNALMNFTGSIIIVSHDREFLTGLTTKTVYFNNKQIIEHSGDIYDFLEKQRLESLSMLELSNNQKTFDNEINSHISVTKLQREEKKLLQKQENKLQKSIKNIENEIDSIEKSIAKLDEEFLSTELYSNPQLTKEKKELHQSLRNILDEKMNEWSDLHEELENLSVKG